LVIATQKILTVFLDPQNVLNVKAI